MVGDNILNYKDDIVKSLCELIKIKSVADTPKENKPFGEGVSQALQYMLSLGESFGFKIKNIDGYAGHVEYGEGEEISAVLVHLDTVPEGTGWSFPPYGGVINDGKIYGRGASDDKSSAVAAIYGLKVLKDLNIDLKRRVRIIFGTDEERGMEDMKYYFTKEPLPNMGFSPDAAYPITNREKGILQLILSEKRYKEKVIAEKSDKVLIHKIQGGEAPNMVAADCKAHILPGRFSQKDIDYIKTAAKRLSNENDKIDIKVDFDKKGGLDISVKGKSAHGASPHSGVNAIYGLLNFLYELQYNGNSIKDKNIILMDEYLKFLYNKKIGYDTKGNALGINMMDEESGELTLNLGKINYNETEKSAKLDIRYPISSKSEEIIKIIEEQAKQKDINVDILAHLAPLYIPKEHPLIIRLSRAYEKITGEKPGLVSMGGGTYARTLQNRGVAFGKAGENAHEPDEYVCIDELMHHARICTQAIYEIAI
jgi:succinyl-diaminopimelate desuccinylase